jgi:hypothetical protein
LNILPDILENAIKGGHTEFVRYFVEETNFELSPKHTRLAAQSGDLELLKYLHEEKKIPLHPDPEFTVTLAEKGSTELLRWAIDQGCIVNEFTCATAAGAGKIGMLKFLRKKIRCPWDSKTTVAAAENRRWDTLRWAVKHGCPWSKNAASAILTKNHEEVFSVLKWAEDRGLEWDDGTFYLAVKHGNVEMLKFLIEKKCPVMRNPVTQAVIWAPIEVLMYLDELGIEFSGVEICGPAFFDYDRPKDCLLADWRVFEILEYALTRGCTWHPKAMSSAATAGNLEFLKFAVDHGAEISNEVIKQALIRGNLEIVQWVHVDLKFPIQAEESQIAAENENWTCLKWLLAHGSGWFAADSNILVKSDPETREWIQNWKKENPKKLVTLRHPSGTYLDTSEKTGKGRKSKDKENCMLM